MASEEEIPLYSINIVFRDGQIERYWDESVTPEEMLLAAEVLRDDALQIIFGEAEENGDE